MKNSITSKELKRQLSYDKTTGFFMWKISTSPVIKIGDIAGSKKSDGYISISINNTEYYAHRLAWLYEYGYLPENGLDHRDRTKHHNWIDNLREVSNQCNMRNRDNFKNNTSGVKGVCWNKKKDKWQSHIMISYKNKFLGYYESFEDAVCARLAGEQCVGWSGCDSSSPAFKYVNDFLKDIKSDGIK